MRYTFEMKLLDSAKWRQMGKAFNTIEDAAKAMADMAVISYDNDFPCSFRLCEFKIGTFA